ncbi:probable protein, unknown function [Plasmodium sp. gorilla clade G3]|nr:probable protein, unknown function [Plasmodium sp. gorilla clade G3]
MITNMNFISRLKRAFSRPSNYLLCFIFCMMSFHSYCLLFDILERLIVITERSNMKIDVSENFDSSLPFSSAETELKISGDHSELEESGVLQNMYEHIEEDMEYDIIDNYEIKYCEQYSDERNIQVYVENYYENHKFDDNQEKQMESNEEQKIEDTEENRMDVTEEEQMEDNEENININPTKVTMHYNLRIHKTSNETGVSGDSVNKISSEYIIYNIFENVMKMSKEFISLIAKVLMMDIEKEEDKAKKEDISEYNYSDLESTLRIIQMILLFDMDSTGTLYPNSR